MLSRRSAIGGGVALALVALITLTSGALLYSRLTTSAEEAVKRFYDRWLAVNVEPGAALAQALHARSTYTTDTFGSSVDRSALMTPEGEVQFDPVLCGREVHGTPGFNQVYEEDGRARFILTNLAADGPVNVYLVKERGWRIDEVDCPDGRAPERGSESVSLESGSAPAGTSSASIVG
ncbi:hypothetical protein GVX82_02145 [Patescibacteria group bacterium]|jgi:hypothetical protein|nr:hypothetical protein [Patescibacteria group bacterium]